MKFLAEHKTYTRNMASELKTRERRANYIKRKVNFISSKKTSRCFDEEKVIYVKPVPVQSFEISIIIEKIEHKIPKVYQQADEQV
jgi:hypothetical protein